MNKLKIKTRQLSQKPHVLRKKGIVPGIMYGPNLEVTPVKASELEIAAAVHGQGEVFTINTKNGKYFVKFDNLQKDPVSKRVTHFSLLEMPRGEENEVEIPVDLKGTPKGVKRGGVLVQLKDEIAVSGTPRTIPDSVKGSVAKLDIGDKLRASDLKMPKNIELGEDPQEVVAVCMPPQKEAIESEKEPEELESTTISEPPPLKAARA